MNFRCLFLLILSLIGHWSVAQHQRDVGVSVGTIKDQRDALLSNRVDSLRSLRVDSAARAKSLRAVEDGVHLKPGVSRKPLTEGVPDVSYDSGHPEAAPWKSMHVSADSLANVTGLPGSTDQTISAPDIDKLKTKFTDVKAPSVDPESLKREIEKVSTSLREEKLSKSTRAFDSLYALKSRFESFSLEQELFAAKRIYSDKYIQKLYDSLGLKKADSIFRMAQKYAKTEVPKEDLLNRLNSDMPQKKGLSYDEESGALKPDNIEKLNSLPDETDKLGERGAGVMSEIDLSDVQLPQEQLVQLPPLPAFEIDTDQLPVIDSLRDIAMKAKNIHLHEDQLTDELKRVSFKKDLSFLDKSYFEGILGVINDTAFTIVQVSPSVGYHFTRDLSLGLGPVLSIEYEQKKINAIVGFRSFVKGEFWKQRGYWQFEDNARPALGGIEDIRTLEHSLLAGGGGLIPLSRKLAINMAVFYRLNQDQVRPGGSPWVFRIGLSSIKSIRP